MKKCPDGFICVENYSMFFIIICVVLFMYVIYTTYMKQNIVVNNSPSEKIIIQDVTERRENYGWWNRMVPSWPYTNLPTDPLLNPYAPPLRDERYFVSGPIPINIPTNIGAVNTSYRQVGILTGVNTNEKILPLMGRPVFTNRNKWQYYGISGDNGVKLPISRNGKSCMNEYGCDQLYNGDTVYVEGLNQPYRVTVYDNDTIQYLPSL